MLTTKMDSQNDNELVMNSDLDVRCGLCEGIIPKYDFNTHLYQHHRITTAHGIRHQKPMELPKSAPLSNDSVSSRKSSVILNLSKQGYDADVHQLLKDDNFQEALDVLKARYLMIYQSNIYLPLRFCKRHLLYNITEV